MKPIKLIILAGLFFLPDVSCSENNGNINDKAIYEFVKYFLDRKTMPAFMNNYPLLDNELTHLYLDFKDSIYLTKERHYFSVDDWSFLLKQAKSEKLFTFDSKRIEGKAVILSDSLRRFNLDTQYSDLVKFLESKYSVSGFNTLSVPLFSKDYKTAIVKCEYFDRAGGMGGIYVFKKNSANWQLVDQLQIWEY